MYEYMYVHICINDYYFKITYFKRINLSYMYLIVIVKLLLLRKKGNNVTFFFLYLIKRVPTKNI